MKENTRIKITATALGGLAMLGVSSLAHAEEVEVEVEVDVRASTTRPLPPRPGTLNQIRAEAQDRLRDLRENVMEQRLENRDERRDMMMDATSSEDRRNIIRDMRENRNEMRDDMREHMQDIRGTIKERIQALVKTHVGAMVRRSENALNMFGNIVDRMTSRIEKLKGAGTDTASVEASLSASVSLIDTAKADLKTLTDLVSSVNTDSDTAAVKEQLRSAIDTLTKSIKAAHASLLDTAKALARLSASSSTSTEVEND